MCLSFVTAGLIVLVQWQVPPAASEFSGSDRVLSPRSDAPIQTLSRVNEAENDGSNKSDGSSGSVSSSPLAQAGLAAALTPVLQPVFAVDAPKLVVDLSDRQVSLYQNAAITASYPIAVGQAGWETPTGNFSVIHLQADPVWQHPFTGEVFPPGADNPLGSRWIGFWTDGQHQIGFHGTDQEDLIGQAVSHGCIRMREADIQALYSQVSLGMPVVIQP